MRQLSYIWAASFVALTLMIATIGIWGFGETLSLIIAGALGIVLVSSVFIYTKAAKSELAASLSTLREANTAGDMKVQGSYNAYHHVGERFRTSLPGDPATVDFNDEMIRVRVFSEHGSERVYEYARENSEILWIGNSGRVRDYLTWLEIKNTTNASLISAFMGTYHQSTEQYTKDLFFKLADCGYKAGVDLRTRGIVFQAIGSIALFLLGVSMLLDKSWFVGSCSILASIVIMALELRPRKAPKRRNR
jgi:hypothetical protein